MYGLTIDLLYLTLDHSKGQGKDHAHFDQKNIRNGDRYEKILLISNTKLFMGFRLAYLRLTLTYSKGQYQVHAHFGSVYPGNCDR